MWLLSLYNVIVRFTFKFTVMNYYRECTIYIRPNASKSGGFRDTLLEIPLKASAIKYVYLLYLQRHLVYLTPS